MVLVIISCLFVFLGMYFGKKYDLKNISINMIFGLFLVNCVCSVFDHGYSLLKINYHSSTWYFVLLGCILGYVIMKIIDLKYDRTDNISICGFTIANSIILLVSKFNILFLIINILYYIVIGIYIRNSKSWFSVIIGMIIGLILGSISCWLIGYLFAIFVGFIIYFVISVYTIIFRNSDKSGYYALIAGIAIALIGSML
jgi:hypothetical protein